jgi:hypothetical protein
MKNKIVPASELLKLVENLLRIPAPRICRHLVACDILSMLESNGFKIPVELAQAVVSCEDDVALQHLETLVKKGV